MRGVRGEGQWHLLASSKVCVYVQVRVYKTHGVCAKRMECVQKHGVCAKSMECVQNAWICTNSMECMR